VVVLRRFENRRRVRVRARLLKRSEHRSESAPARTLDPLAWKSVSARAVLWWFFGVNKVPWAFFSAVVLCFFLAGGLGGHGIEI